MDFSKMEQHVFRSRVTNALSWKESFVFDATSFWSYTFLATLLFLVANPLFYNSLKKTRRHASTPLPVSPYILFLYIYWSQSWTMLLYTLSIFFFFFWCFFCGYYRMHWLPSFVFGTIVMIMSYIVLASFTKENNEYVYYLSNEYLLLTAQMFFATLLFYKSNTFFTVLLGSILANMIASAIFVMKNYRHNGQ